MMATLGLLRGLLGSSGEGDRIFPVIYWYSWNPKRNGCTKGFSTLDSVGMMEKELNICPRELYEVKRDKAGQRVKD